MAVIDNVTRPLEGDTACALLTSSSVIVRRLGVTEALHVPSATFWLATGNNLSALGDMTRRVLFSWMDAGCERPELRSDFQIADLRAWALSHRADMLSAVFTIRRAHIVAGSPACGLTPIGSFEGWSRTIRNALVWADAPDPHGSAERIRAEDPQAQAQAEVFAAWHAVYGDEPLRMNHIRKLAERVHDPGIATTPADAALVDALAELGPRLRFDARAVGDWLRANKGRFAGPLRLSCESHKKGAIWRVSDTGS